MQSEIRQSQRLQRVLSRVSLLTTTRARGAARGGAVRKAAIRRLRLPGLVAAMAASLLAALLLPATGAQAAFGLPNAFYANVTNLSSNLCMNVDHDLTSWGTWIIQYHCDGTGASDFHFVVRPDGSYWIVGEHSGLCVFPTNTPDEHLVQDPCDFGGAHEWNVLPVFGTWQLQLAGTRNCVFAPDSKEWTDLRLTACNIQATNQNWYLDNLLAG